MRMSPAAGEKFNLIDPKAHKSVLVLYALKASVGKYKTHVPAYLMQQIDEAQTVDAMFSGKIPFRIGIIEVPKSERQEAMDKISTIFQQINTIFKRYPLALLYANLNGLEAEEANQLNQMIDQALAATQNLAQLYAKTQDRSIEKLLQSRMNEMDQTLEKQGYAQVGTLLHRSRFLGANPLVIAPSVAKQIVALGNLSIEELKVLLHGLLRDMYLRKNDTMSMRDEEGKVLTKLKPIQ